MEENKNNPEDFKQLVSKNHIDPLTLAIAFKGKSLDNMLNFAEQRDKFMLTGEEPIDWKKAREEADRLRQEAEDKLKRYREQYGDYVVEYTSIRGHGDCGYEKVYLVEKDGIKAFKTSLYGYGIPNGTDLTIQAYEEIFKIK